MRIKAICFLLPLFLLSCSKQSNSVQSQNQSRPQSLPFNVTVVETPERKEIDDLSDRANALLAAKDYDNLDALAKKLRDSKESIADGTWMLSMLYDGLVLQDKTPDTNWTARLAALNDWINARPDSITARVALANELVSYAWKARGSDYADKVSNASWAIFFQRLNKAVNVLDAARGLKEKCPCWYEVMLETELGLHAVPLEYDATFNAAVKAWPDYTPYYTDRAYYLLPRWYGADGEWERDLKESADKIGGENGDALYAQVVWGIHQYSISTNIMKEYQLSWNRVNAGLEVIEKRFPNSLAVKNEGARLAVVAGDEQAARKFFDQTHGEIDLACWDSKDDFVRFANLVYGCSSQ